MLFFICMRFLQSLVKSLLLSCENYQIELCCEDLASLWHLRDAQYDNKGFISEIVFCQSHNSLPECRRRGNAEHQLEDIARTAQFALNSLVLKQRTSTQFGKEVLFYILTAIIYAFG